MGASCQLCIFRVLLLWAASTLVVAADKAQPLQSARCIQNTTISDYKIALGIVGVSRGLKYTLPSIERHVLNVLTEHGIAFDLFWSSVTNPYFYGRPIDEYEFQLARPCLFSIEPQDVVRHLQWERFCKSRGFICENGLIRNVAGKVYSAGGRTYTRMDRRHFGKYVTPRMSQLRNYFCAFDSQHRLARMIQSRSEMGGFEYDAVLVIRPDVAFIRDIDLPKHINSIKTHPDHIWIPDFQPFDGLNDRAAFGSQRTMLQYLDRGETFFSSNTYHFDIAEAYLAKFVTDFSIIPQNSSMRFLRIRPLEIKGVSCGVVDGFDSQAEYMNLAGDNKDLIRCAGTQWFLFDSTKVKRLNPFRC